MVDINIFDSTAFTQIAVLVVALGLSFLSLKAGAFLWFVTSFAWLGLAALISNNVYVASVCALMALFCQVLFIAGLTRRSRR